jgi:hypothetical protein
VAKPIAITGGEQTHAYADLPLVVGLNGASSTADAGRTIVSYSWTFLEVPQGSAAVLASAATATPNFTADKPGTYLAVLEVTDSGAEISDTDVRTMPATAYAAVTVTTQFLALKVPAWQQRRVSRELQSNWHALDAEIGAVRGRLDALETP